MKKVLIVVKGILWFVVCWFAGAGSGNMIREGREEGKTSKMVLGIIATVINCITVGWVGYLVGDKLYDEWDEIEEGKDE